MFTGTLKYRDIIYKNHKQPRDVLDRDIMTKNQSYTWGHNDLQYTVCNESRDVLILGHFIQQCVFGRDNGHNIVARRPPGIEMAGGGGATMGSGWPAGASWRGLTRQSAFGWVGL
jgi:hypothetical protein